MTLFELITLLVFLCPNHVGSDGNCYYRISEINCHSLDHLHGESFRRPCFIELELYCPNKESRSKRNLMVDPFLHDLSSYTVVLWDRGKEQSWFVLPLSNV
ncbi:hypothetical protein RvY_18768-6 [Ramazzottius varieornatus]|uniref:Uncharacterized protein n=1 Tax=Ramazzottius varieornatus TaxID=947166 RepID=A0A1D1W715_RAMVA|nr:hypothetical protein RvY_18768-6 [Ramazzottius varieornatus]